MSQLVVLDRYGRRFGNQETRDTGGIEVSRNSAVHEICRRYERWLDEEKELLSGDSHILSLNILDDLIYTSGDVREFSLSLSQYQRRENFYKTGAFLSGLIEICPEKEFEIITKHLDKPINVIGFENRKNIVVQGNVGHFLGARMKGGSVVVYGDAEADVGYCMHNGLIVVKGNTGRGVGLFMENGSIKVDVDIGKISHQWIGGKIYHHGALVRGVEE